MKKCRLNINYRGLKFPNQLDNKHDPEADIIDNRSKTFIEINAWDLTVTTRNKSGSKNSVSFNLEYPFAFNASSSFGNDFFAYDTPNLLSFMLNSFLIASLHLI